MGSCASPVTSPLLRPSGLVRGASAGCYQPLLPTAPSRRYFLRFFLRMPEPLPRRCTECACLVLPPCHRPSPHRDRSAFPLRPANTTFHGSSFRGCSYFVMFRPPLLLASQVAPTAARRPAGQPRRLRPSRTCVVTFARIGYAIG